MPRTSMARARGRGRPVAGAPSERKPPPRRRRPSRAASEPPRRHRARSARALTCQYPHVTARPRCHDVVHLPPSFADGGAPTMVEVNRRAFLGGLGVTVGTSLAATMGSLPLVGVAQAQPKPKGNIPDTPYKI